MSEINDGGPAFPVPHTPDYRIEEGMSLWDYFAAKAMEAIILVPYEDEDEEMLPFEMFAEKTAVSAFIYADAMIAERARRLNAKGGAA